jgi:phospholipase C
MGPTWPIRFFLHAASSGGRKTNRPKPFLRSIWDVLDDGDKRGINYFSDLPWAAGAMARLSGFARLKSFFQHAEEGSLPDFSIIDPGFFMSTSDHPREFGGDSDHPEMGPNVALGQLFIATLYQALANSPSWNETMLVITYDESGGFFDHVPPPTTVDDDPEFTQLGFRVPGLIIGPHVRRGCVNNNVFDHTSVIATATNKFGLETINQRVAAASDLSSAINPEFLGAPQPPIQLPQVAVPTDLIEKFTSVNTQPELGIAADYGDIPAHLDLRPEMLGNLRELVGKAHDFGLVKPVLRVRDR